MQPSENPLLVFVSSVQRRTVENLTAERVATIDAIRSLELTRPWAFEETPASADPVEESYLQKVRECDLFIIVLGRGMTDAVEREWVEARRLKKRRLVFVKRSVSRVRRAEKWLATQVDVKYGLFQGPTDLRERVRTAVIDELVRGYRRFALRRDDYRRLAENIRSAAISFAVRTISAEDLPDISSEFPQLSELYPNLEEWMDDKRAEVVSGKAEAYVAQYEDNIAGFSLVSGKGEAVRKISTLYVKPSHQGLGVGPRLLYDIIVKAAEDGCEKLYVTVSEERREELDPLLSHYQFHVEGVSGRRYRRGSAEWVWAKRLVHGCLTNDALSDFVRIHMLEERGFEVADAKKGWLFARRHADSLGFSSVMEQPLLMVAHSGANPDDDYEQARVFAESRGLRILFVGASAPHQARPGDVCLDAHDLETMFFPLYFQRPIDGVIVVIRQAFSRNLIPSSYQQQLLAPTRIQLRTDNVYYLYPRLVGVVGRATPLFFYETHPVSGASRLVGEAKVVETAVDEPKDLFARFGNLGVYTLDDLERTAESVKGQHAGRAFAIKFDWYREARQPLTPAVVQTVLPTYNPSTIRRITSDKVMELRRACGWNVKELSFR